MDSCAWLGFSPPPVRLPVEARHGSLVQVPLRQANLQAIQQPVEAMWSGRTWKTNSQIRDKRSRGQNTSKETAKVACAVASCAPLEFNITRPQPLKRAVGETKKKKSGTPWALFWLRIRQKASLHFLVNSTVSDAFHPAENVSHNLNTYHASVVSRAEP